MEKTTDRHARDLAQTSPQRTIACRDDVAPVGVDPFDDAVVCVGTLVGAGETFEARVARDAVREGWSQSPGGMREREREGRDAPEREAVLLSELLELGDDAVGDAGDAWGRVDS